MDFEVFAEFFGKSVCPVCEDRTMKHECGIYYDGDNHHCDPKWERRSEAARNAEREDYDRRAYGTKLEDGFDQMGFDDWRGI